MTAQILDIVIFNGTTYGVGAFEGIDLFNPANVGLDPVAWTTACYRGFHCIYEVRDQSLWLTTLYIGLTPETVESMQRGEHPRVFDQIPGRYYNQFWRMESSDYVVDELNEPISCSGGMLIGHYSEPEFNQPFQVWYGLQFFDVVYELLFEKGKLIETYDRTQAVAEYYSRRFEQEDTEELRLDTLEWLKHSFAVEYSSLTFWFNRPWYRSNTESS